MSYSPPAYGPSFDLTGRVAIVTGGSRGIGRSISVGLAAYGAHVVVSSRKLETCEFLVEQIRQHGGQASAMACDTGDVDSIKSLVSTAHGVHGKLDILVNNSAANPWAGHILKLPEDAYNQTVDVVIRGSLFASIEAGKIMKAQQSGVIINTGSINAQQPVLGQGIYSIAKGAVTTMTKSMAKELGLFNVRVNAILPGITRTEPIEGVFQGGDDLPEPWKSMTSLRRHAMPDEMAGAAVFLASDAASYITGECLVVDGGITI